MYNNEKVGIGILTYNRQDICKQLIEQISNIDYIDNIIIVKDKDIQYDYNITDLIENNSKITYFNQLNSNDSSIAKNKNYILNHLLTNNVDHIFIIEDDMLIKNANVFKKYIDTAKSYNLGHLNFGGAWDSITKKVLSKSLNVNNQDGIKMDIYTRLCGCFSYFSRECIQNCGFYDEDLYNAFEHILHTYTISSKGYYTPFHYFADIEKSYEMLEYTENGKDTTLNNNVAKNEIIFKQKISNNNHKHATVDDLKQFLTSKKLSKSTNIKYSVLTYIFNGYEKLREVVEVDPLCEYVVVTDDPDMKSETWKVIYDEKLKDLSPFDKTFYVRYHPFEYVTNDIVIKMDGNILIKKPLTPLINKFISENYDIAIMPHPIRHNILEELKAWIKSRQYPIEQAQRQANLIAMLNYNPNIKGLVQATLSIERNTKLCEDIRNLTYDFCKFVGTNKTIDRLDQTVYTLILHKFFENIIKVLPLSEQVIRSNYMQWYWHNSNEPNMNIFYNINDKDMKYLFDKQVECFYI